MNNKLRWTQIELPSLHLLWKRDNEEGVVSSVIRTNYPKPGLTSIPSIVQQTGLCDVEAVDMKIRDQDTIVPYREFQYGDGIMVASRMGVPFEKLEETLLNTDILGLSINPTSWANIAKDFMQYAKDVNPDIKIVIGGNEATFRPETYLRDGLADIAMLGEAEISLPNLIQSLREKSDLRSVKGIAYNEVGEVIRTGMPDKPSMEDVPLPALDILKDDISLWTTPIESFPLPEGVDTPIGFTFFTRGCYQSCDYCTSPRKMGKFRFNSLERIAEELDHFKEHGITTLNVWDDSLTSVMYPGALGREEGRRYLIDLAQLIRDKGFAYEFSQGVVIKDLWDKERNQPDFELINTLYSNEIRDGKFVGCYGEYFPTEFLQVENPHDRCEKLEDFEVEKEILKAILNAGTKFFTYSSIMGSNEDSPENFEFAKKRMAELKELIKTNGGRSLATPFIYTSFPGTKLWDKEEMNLEYSIDEFPELYQLNVATQKTEHFKPHELVLAKEDLEEELMSPGQFARWQSTGRYQWPEIKK
ncbi:hypothetical protein CL618_00155 [archaeon]|nr:hypothetical protein [archaeon]|tara:strand:+ start:466 stop:2055 length:1590 start_codon:yes stop_codon:yes gene_type:complete